MADYDRNDRYGGFGQDRNRADDYRGYGDRSGRGQNHSRYGTGYGPDRADRDDFDERDPAYRAYSPGGGYGQSSQGGYQGRDRGYAASRQSDHRYGERDDGRFGNADEARRVPIDETSRLIASDKVEGTAVYSRRGDKLGTVRNFMVEKRSGRVEYAVLAFGGFLGVGERYHPLPWNMLAYDERMGGYVVDLDERTLERAPSHRAGDRPNYDGAYGADINSYYGVRR